MLRFAANLSFLFNEKPFLERFECAARNGFQGVEYLFPYEWPAEQLANCLSGAGLEQVLFNLYPGDWAKGERGFACHPGREQVFLESVEQAIEYAKILNCRRLHAMSGLRLAGVEEAVLRKTFEANLRRAAARCSDEGITLLIEPINSIVDMPGYWLDSAEKAFEIATEINHPALKVQLDLYHAHVMGCDVAALIKKYWPLIGHMQLADFPGRHEPGTGEMNYGELFDLIEQSDYKGWVGCEYRPLGETQIGLNWRLHWM